jgi:hypothetical protein
LAQTSRRNNKSVAPAFPPAFCGCAKPTRPFTCGAAPPEAQSTGDDLVGNPVQVRSHTRDHPAKSAKLARGYAFFRCGGDAARQRQQFIAKTLRLNTEKTPLPAGDAVGCDPALEQPLKSAMRVADQIAAAEK